MKSFTVEIHFDNEVNTTLKGVWDLGSMRIKPEKQQTVIENTVLKNFN